MGVLDVFKIVQMVPNCAKDHILTLMMIILMTMFLKLLFMLDLWLGVINVKNVHVKKMDGKLMPIAWREGMVYYKT